MFVIPPLLDGDTELQIYLVTTTGYLRVLRNTYILCGPPIGWLDDRYPL